MDNYIDEKLRDDFRNYYVPEIIKIFKDNKIELKSVVDISCRTGMILSEFQREGILDILGLDHHVDERYLEIPIEKIKEVNYKNLLIEERKYSLAICVQSIGRIDDSEIDPMIRFLTNASDLVLFSASIPYQDGKYCINQKWPNYWRNEFEKYGYVCIDYFRKKIWDRMELDADLRQNLMIYVNKSKIEEFQTLKKYYCEQNDNLPENIVHPVIYKTALKNQSIELFNDCNPKTKLEYENLVGAILLPDRDELLKQIPENGIVAEVGVAEGRFSRKILDICHPKKLYCIDIWLNEKIYNEAIETLKIEIESGVVEILRGDSVEMLSQLENKVLDFVYIDAMHDYIHPKNELEICAQKVKDSGYIAGHDYTLIDSYLNPAERYGVVNAVNEFVVKNKYKFEYFTMEHLFNNPSYCLKKL